MLLYLFILGVTRANFGINCKDNPSIQCSTVDCSQTIKRALCPETCNLCSKINEMTCRDNGGFCDVMSCTHASAKVMCAKSCNLCGASSGSSIASPTAATSSSAVASAQVNCIDKNKNCHTNLCGHAFGQHQCPKTCNPKCQIKTTRAPYIRTTRPPRPTKPPRTPKPPKIAKNILESSPCQDNPMYVQMCGSALLKCDKAVGKMFCMRSCGLCASIDQMFVCKDARPDLCHMINCDNYLAGQYCAKSCNKCLKPHHMRQAAKTTKATTRAVKTTKATTTRRAKARKTTSKTTTTMAPAAQCKDDPSYVTICRDPSLDCTNILVTTVCRKSCNVCESRSQVVITSPVTTMPPTTTTQRTLMTKAKVKCSKQDILALGCSQECKIENNAAMCICWKGFKLKGRNCVEENPTYTCLKKPTVGCKLTVGSIQTLHIEIFNPSVPERKCFGSPLSKVQVVAPMSCVNRLGTSRVSVQIIRSEAPDLIKTSHTAKVSRAMFKSNLALVTIDDIMNNDDEDQCYGADFLPSETTQCFATGLGTIRDATFVKPAVIGLNFDERKSCSASPSSFCATSNNGRLDDLDLGSTVSCRVCSSCALFRFGMVLDVNENFVTVRSIKTILEQLSMSAKSTQCFDDTEISEPLTTVTLQAITSGTSTSATIPATTAIISTSMTTGLLTKRKTTSKENILTSSMCCFIAKVTSSTKDAQFTRSDKIVNGAPVYFDSQLKLYMWYAEYKETNIWIITPTVGLRKNAVFIGNSDSMCPDGVTDWLVWKQQKWVAHETTLECLLQTNPDNSQWLKWSAWAPCSFKKCDGTETRTRVRYCTGDECVGSSTDTETCPTADCEKLKGVCCEEIETDFTVINGRKAKFEFDRILDDRIVYREKSYHDIFLYNVGDHWEIGKGLLQKTIYHKSNTFHAECPTRTGLQWLTVNETVIEGSVKCSTRSRGWTEWSSCLELCQNGKSEATRKRTCQEVPHDDSNYAKCQNVTVERKPCQCDDFAKLLEMDQQCCSTFELKFKESDFNGVYYKYLDGDEKVHYRNKKDYFLYWSEEYFSWIVTHNDMSETNVLLRLHGNENCFLERNHASNDDRRRRSSSFISNQFKDNVWKSFNIQQLRWITLDETDIALTCI